jgi:hypothetical protein
VRIIRCGVIRGIVNATLAGALGRVRRAVFTVWTDPIPPERLLRALLLQAFYWIRSERQRVQRNEIDLLFRWLVGLDVDDPSSDVTATKRTRTKRPITRAPFQQPVSDAGCTVVTGSLRLAEVSLTGIH